MGEKEELMRETIKWLKRIKEKLKTVHACDERGEEIIKNVKAYVSDTEYFLNKGDLVRAFECIVWAWAWLEIGLRFGFMNSKDNGG